MYMEDMLVKSVLVKQHLLDLSEMFKTMRKHKMRLNPGKCVFGVLARKFLGFMVS